MSYLIHKICESCNEDFMFLDDRDVMTLTDTRELIHFLQDFKEHKKECEWLKILEQVTYE